jgi:rhamnosyl/mannosyltransferase
LQNELEVAAREWKLGDRLRLAGWQDRKRLKILLHAADVFAFPSTSTAETFGIAQLEAMATGLPIVNTALPTAVPHVARHGLESLTVAPADSDAMAAALRRLLQDTALATRLGKAGRERALQCFDQDLMRARIRTIYQEAALEQVSRSRIAVA